VRRIGALSAVFAIAAVATSCGGPDSLATRSAAVDAPVITIEAGLTPRMTVEQLETAVLDRIHGMELQVGTAVRTARIVSVTATTSSGVEALEPGVGHPDPAPPGIQWLVRAEGTFTNNRVAPRGSPMVAATGFFVIDDADGGVIAFGFP
jgi:hypothetical protein